MRRTGTVVVLGAFLAIVGGPLVSSARSTLSSQSTTSPPGMLERGGCYRFVLPVLAAPHYKVLAIGEEGWIEAEVDAGPAAARREPVWINTTQIISIRTVRCSA